MSKTNSFKSARRNPSPAKRRADSLSTSPTDRVRPRSPARKTSPPKRSPHRRNNSPRRQERRRSRSGRVRKMLSKNMLASIS